MSIRTPVRAGLASACALAALALDEFTKTAVTPVPVTEIQALVVQ